MNSLKPRILKAQVRRTLNGKYSFFASTTLLLVGCNLVLGSILSFTMPSNNTIFSFLLYLISLLIVNTIYNILLSGVYRLYLHTLRNEPCSFSDLKDAFLEHPEPIALYSILALAVELGCVYASTYAFLLPDVYISLGLLLIILFVMIWFGLTYRAVLFLHACDPQASASELLLRSRSMMRGHRLKLLWLVMTFLGALLLGVLSFGIGLLFALPYLTMTVILFYSRIAQPEEV